MKKLLVIICYAALLFACKEDENAAPDTQIELSAQNLVFNTEGTALNGNTVTVKCAGEWRMTDNCDWITPSATKGASGASVVFEALPNDSEEIREVTYTFMCGDKVAQVVITQGPEEVLEYTTDTADFTVAQAGGYITVGLRTNVGLQYEVDADCKEWILPDRGTDAQNASQVTYVQFRILEHADAPYRGRIGKVTLFPGTAGERVLNVTQKQKDVLFIRCDELVGGIYTGTTAEGEVTVSVDANVDYTNTIAAKAQTWLTCTELEPDGEPEEPGLVRRTYKYSFSEATGSRSGKVTFAASGVASEVFSIVQQSANPVYGTFPDANFRKYLIDNAYIGEPIDADFTCEIYDEGMKLTTMKVPYSSTAPITSIEGIGSFTELTSLDVSNIRFTDLDLRGNTKLTTLTASSCYYMETIDLSANDLLATLNMANPRALKVLDLSGKSLLTTLNASGGIIEQIDLSGCSALKTINVSQNNIQKLDVSQCGALSISSFNYTNNPFCEFNLGDQNITSIALTNAHFKSSLVYTPANLLPKSFTLTGSKVTSLDITISTSNLKAYDVLEWIDINGAPALKTIKCRRVALLCTAIYLGETQTQPTSVTKDTKTLFVRGTPPAE